MSDLTPDEIKRVQEDILQRMKTGEKPKLIIHNPDGSTTEVEPIKPWSPCHYKDGACIHCGAKEPKTMADQALTHQNNTGIEKGAEG